MNGLPVTDAEKLRLLADWHDKRDDEGFFPVPEHEREVQADLRRIAARLDALDDLALAALPAADPVPPSPRTIEMKETAR